MQSVSRIQYLDQKRSINTDEALVESPLVIQLLWNQDQQPQSEILTMTMRTPGDDLALVLGLLLTENIIRDFSELECINYEQGVDNWQNHIDVQFREHCQPQLSQAQRQLMSTSSCGLCGKALLQALDIRQSLHPVDASEGWLTRQSILKLEQRLKKTQDLFAQTGGVHGAALFDGDGKEITSAEDIGRHNAVDKVIGKYMSDSEHIPQCILMLSSRLSFELLQKAVAAGFPVVAAVGAPSSMAIDVAKRFNLTLLGFVKSSGFNLYHGDWRLSH